MTDLWADYQRETYGRTTVYFGTAGDGAPMGLWAWELQGPDLYVTDIYVRPEYRRAGVGRAMFTGTVRLARELGCTRILGTVDVSRPGWRESIQAQESVGFKLTATNDRGQALLVYALNDAGE